MQIKHGDFLVIMVIRLAKKENIESLEAFKSFDAILTAHNFKNGSEFEIALRKDYKKFLLERASKKA